MNPPAPGPGERALGHPGRERGGDAGVDRVAAFGEHTRAGLGGQRVAGCDRALHRDEADLGLDELLAFSACHGEDDSIDDCTSAGRITLVSPSTGAKP